MVDRITGQSLNELQLQPGQLNQVDRAGAGSENAKKAAAKNALGDKADISDEARSMVRSHADVMKFAAKASRIEEPVNPKVAELRDMVENGRISDILSRYSSDMLATDLLEKAPALLR